MLEADREDDGSAREIRATYDERLRERQRSHEKWTWLDRRVADVRLVVAAVAVVLTVLILRGWEIGYGWLGLVAGLFAVLVLAHEPIRKRADKARRAVEFYSGGLARLDERWAGMGVSGDEFLDLDHPYAADLDIFGRGSLFERLCMARHAGRRRHSRGLAPGAGKGGHYFGTAGGHRRVAPAP